jgi:hypothetical protein
MNGHTPPPFFLPRNEALALIDDINLSFGVNLTPGQLDELINETAGVIEIIQRFGSDDTDVKEKLINQLAVRLELPGWPLYSDGQQAFDDFIIKFKQRAIETGYTYTGE